MGDAQVELPDLPPILRGGESLQDPAGAAEVVGQDLELTDLLDGLGELLYAVIGHEVQGDAVVAFPVAAELVLDGVQLILGPGDKDHSGPFPGQLKGDGATDAAAGTGDQSKTVLNA